MEAASALGCPGSPQVESVNTGLARRDKVSGHWKQVSL